MHVSIEVPVFKGEFLRPCIDSVLAQTSNAWTLSLLWDGGDALSRRLLEELEGRGHPRIQVYFGDNRGIAGARKFLTDHSSGDYILPLDDDDVLLPQAVQRFVEVARERPWASLVRARRRFIDTHGATVDQAPWFPFAPRSYRRGMVKDVFNQAQPYLIRRSAYERTEGWRGFSDLMGAGEDCDIFLQLEQIAHFELVDEVLYGYRLHGSRASDELTSAAAFDMWRRLADAAVERMGLPLRRVSEAPPFGYEEEAVPPVSLDDVDFVVPGTADADLTGASLSRCGMPADAIHHGDPKSRYGWQMDGYGKTTRPLVGFVEGGVEVEARTALEALVHGLDGKDLVALRGDDSGRLEPPVLLVRRPVIEATGGFDGERVPTSVRGMDLCMQAERRDFRYAEVERAGWNVSAGGTNVSVQDLDVLRRKWQSYPKLLRRRLPDQEG